MSELKAYMIKGITLGDFHDVYLKSEADKVIVEQATLRAWAEMQLRHHKYKRCMAMAKWCENEEKRLEAIAPLFDTTKECLEYNSDYWKKWLNHWLELAEKFKEGK